jgi:hypothetical protein
MKATIGDYIVLSHRKGWEPLNAILLFFSHRRFCGALRWPSSSGPQFIDCLGDLKVFEHAAWRKLSTRAESTQAGAYPAALK